jgi:hypothetical protein
MAVNRPGAGARAWAVPVALLAACGGSKAAPPATPPGVSLALAPTGAPVDFDFDSVDDRAVSARSTRGKPAVIAFVTTSSLPSQAQVDFLVAMARHDGDRVNYAVVAVEPAASRELVEVYGRALGTPFPVAMADSATLAGGSAFGDVSGVPITVVLDRAGRIVWRADGRVARSDELRGVLHGL